MRPTKELSNVFGFVTLNRAYAVPNQWFLCIFGTLQKSDFVYTFLDVVLSKILLPACRNLLHSVCAKCFGYSEQGDFSRVTSAG